MPSEKNLVSVIIATYNRESFLKRALESVRNQTHRDLEIIIVDDGSTDGTAELVRACMAQDPRIVYLKNEKNLHLTTSLNRGLAASRGEFIALLDDDDEWEPEKIAHQLAAARQIQKPALIVCGGWDYTRKDNFLIDMGMPSGFIPMGSGKTPLSYDIPLPSHWFIPRSVFDAVGAWDTSFKRAGDRDLLLRMFEAGIPVYYLNEPLVKRNRLTEVGYISKFGESKVICREMLLAKHKETFAMDKEYLFRFYNALGKDCRKLRMNKKARMYYGRALRLKPYKLELIGKVLTCW